MISLLHELLGLRVLLHLKVLHCTLLNVCFAVGRNPQVRVSEVLRLLLLPHTNAHQFSRSIDCTSQGPLQRTSPRLG